MLLLGTGTWIWMYAATPSSGTGAVTVFIPKGAGVRRISAILDRQGLVADDIRFLILARLTGRAGRLQAGEYRLPRGRTPLQILRLLAQGEVIRHQVTIPEGLNISQIATLLAKDHWIDRQRFLALTRDPEFIKTLGLHQASLEGYLFPDTYSLIRGQVDERTIISLMVHQFHHVWREITKKSKPRLSPRQVVTLASIVEKETGKARERPLIARVFLNRLQRNMRLQSDPTVIYGTPDFNGDLTRADLERKTPYNTYVIFGLPPGPICNPGRASLEAVLHPADSPALYFVSRNDGSHCFSTTLKEHNRAVFKYQKKFFHSEQRHKKQERPAPAGHPITDPGKKSPGGSTRGKL